jgi:hypothetical protein
MSLPPNASATGGRGCHVDGHESMDGRPKEALEKGCCILPSPESVPGPRAVDCIRQRRAKDRWSDGDDEPLAGGHGPRCGTTSEAPADPIAGVVRRSTPRGEDPVHPRKISPLDNHHYCATSHFY